MTQTTQDRVYSSTREATHFSSCVFHLGIVKEFTMKTCSRCGETKPKTEFGVKSRNKDGLAGYCKECNALASYNTRQRNLGVKIPYTPLRPADKDGKRWCSICKTYKKVTEFHITNQNKSGLSGHCKSCESSRKPSTPKTIHERRMSAMKNDYGITEMDFQDIMNDQKGCCAICGKDFSLLPKRAHVDHNHETGAVRGLLCQKCNMLLSQARENPAILFAAVTYLESWEYAI